jgi:hypothetical protein
VKKKEKKNNEAKVSVEKKQHKKGANQNNVLLSLSSS